MSLTMLFYIESSALGCDMKYTVLLMELIYIAQKIPYCLKIVFACDCELVGREDQHNIESR